MLVYGRHLYEGVQRLGGGQTLVYRRDKAATLLLQNIREWGGMGIGGLPAEDSDA
jgi:hypothetical protein